MAAGDSAAIALEEHPQVLFALAPALSRCCATEQVSSSVASAVLVLFPGADYISIQLAASPGQLLSAHNLKQEGPCRLQLLPGSSLAGTALASRSMVSSSAARCDAKLLDVATASRSWGSRFYLAVPLFVDAGLRILERSLHAELQTDDYAAAAAQIVDEYAALAATAKCIGAITIGTRDQYAFETGHMANMCLVACVTALHMSLDSAQLLAAPHVAALLHEPAREGAATPPAVGCSDGGCEGGIRQRREQVAASSSGGAPEGRGVPPSSAGSSSKDVCALEDEDDVSQGALLNFVAPRVEREYMRWMAASWLQTQRLLNLFTGFPWLLLSGFTNPWRLCVHARGVWAVMAGYLLAMAYVLWRRPDTYIRHHSKLTLAAWFFPAFFFPLSAGHIPVSVLPVETLRGLPWFPFSCGCLTSVVVPITHMARFFTFVPCQALSIAAHAPHIHKLCSRLGGGWWCYARAYAWVLIVSVGLAGFLVRWTDARSRRAFLRSRHRHCGATAALRAH